MKAIIFSLIIFLPFVGKSQQDTLEISSWELADSIYGNLGTHIPTGFLLNRTLLDTTASFAYNTDKKSEYTSNADLYYRLMQELKMMALDTSVIPDLYSLYLDASTFTAGYEFDEDRVVYPIGIADYEYNFLDPTYAHTNGLVSLNGLTVEDTDPNNSSAYTTKTCALIGPLSDYFSSDDISIVFRAQDFKSNYRSLSEVQTIEVAQYGVWSTIVFEEEYQLSLEQSALQYFQVRITYTDRSTLVDSIFINTPELFASEPESRGSSVCDFDDKIQLTDPQYGYINLKYCLVRGCNNSTNQPNKPYVLVTGFRPPIVGQSFDKSWEIYSDYHGHLLSSLTSNNYDVYIVKFNIHANPQGHGMQESAELLIRFLEYINDNKYDDYNETVLQGSSMGADIARLALLKMEQTHWNDQTYPHHHTRLFISHDANYYGGNVPLGYQYHIYSGFHHNPLTVSPFPGESMYLRVFLYATVKQKAVKELLTYHVEGNGFPFALPVKEKDIVPTHDGRRTNFLSALTFADNHQYIVPLPASTRNIAVSLGKISGTNTNNSQNLNFKDRGQAWVDRWFPGILKIKTAEFNASSYKNLYHREEVIFTNFWFPIPYLVKHVLNVKDMQEVDNASGSFIPGVGNIALMTDFAYNNQGYLLFAEYAQAFEYQQLFSHKSVFTALAINKNLWPSNGSSTLDMQTLGLMYESYEDLNNQPPILSNHYGFPNLGRPNDHFSVTPFEAIAVDHEIDPHIIMKNADHENMNKLNELLLNEVEPWYLGLQNEELGSQARSNYTYPARRRAKFHINVGHLVTPKTDPGDYVVNENARLRLEAGEGIDLHPGTTFKNGCEATLTIQYQPCHSGMVLQNNAPSDHLDKLDYLHDYRDSDEYVEDKQRYIEASEIRAFPNPSDGSFTLVNMQDVPISRLVVYDLSGNLVLEHKNIGVARYVCDACLSTGVYVLKVHFGDHSKQLKLIVP